MKPTELRLGNLTSAGVVTEINAECFYVHDGESSLKSTWFDVKPIPIDEKVLIACGFEAIEDGWYSIEYNNIEINWNIYDKRVRANGNSIYNIEFLHQLQNLYFALTGQELELKKEI